MNRFHSVTVVLIVAFIGSTGNRCRGDVSNKVDRVANKQAATESTAKKRKPNPAYLPPTVDPALPNVLLLGDSISIGYMVSAREALAGVANVWRPATNCGPTTRGLESIEEWIGNRKWDVIHFNFGLHDLKYMGPNGRNLADPKAASSHVQVPLADYEKNIETIARRLKKTGATVIWRETTPVPEGASGRVVGDAKKFNEAAARAIKKVGGIQTDPFYDFAMSHSSMQRAANVHYTPEGSQKLGEHVAEVVANALKSR